MLAYQAATRGSQRPPFRTSETMLVSISQLTARPGARCRLGGPARSPPTARRRAGLEINPRFRGEVPAQEFARCRRPLGIGQGAYQPAHQGHILTAHLHLQPNDAPLLQARTVPGSAIMPAAALDASPQTTAKADLARRNG